ncbi:beta-1-3-galactosyltransferase 1-like [Brachionus plicatilis]|uniref:Hexosyltransferase n=1 Tax=Brachionus plicatilis TaxID=10195 RepID=A0A3M7PXM2_BRAPC|nr:beta-1-3-galactosyltransferase 1-like [Brachionus plicatilis]
MLSRAILKIYVISLIFVSSIGFYLNFKWTKQFHPKSKLINSSKIINPHNFSFILNPANSLCQNQKGTDILLICLVEVTPCGFFERQQIRETWANKSLFKNIRTVFLVGLSNNVSINQLLAEESQTYEDIVQEDFIDSYENLTLKTIMGLKWLTEYCSNAKFALKTDDDVVVNMPVLERYIEKLECDKVYMGYTEVRPRVNRKKESKFYISEKEYEKKFYDSYQFGVGYFLSKDLYSKFYNESLYTKYLKFEDVYVGMLAKKLNVKPKKKNRFYSFNRKKSEKMTQCLKEKNDQIFLAYVYKDSFRKIWNCFFS